MGLGRTGTMLRRALAACCFTLGTSTFASAGDAPTPSCSQGWPEPEQTLSVAWVSKRGKRVPRRKFITVVQTRTLREAAQGQSVAVLLQQLGLRKQEREPRGNYKVMMFDVVATSLCRPVEFEPDAVELSGVAVCSKSVSRRRKHEAGCGWSTNLATGELGFPLYRARYKDLSVQGFTVWPMQRFLATPK